MFIVSILLKNYSFALVLILFTFVIGYAIYEYKEKCRKSRNISTFIESLTVDDFTFTKETDIGVICVNSLSNNIGKVMKLDGKHTQRMCIKFEQLLVYSEYNFTPCKNNIVEINDEDYKEYLETVKDFSVIEVEVYVLTAEINDYKLKEGLEIIKELINQKVYEQKNYMSQYRTDIKIGNLKDVSKFVTERYNILNLITDKEPYTTRDYDVFVDSIKMYMRETLL
jgi:hypothetical protein